MRAAELPGRLRALLNSTEAEPQGLDPAQSWAVFKTLLAEPISDPGVEDDLASFQCGCRQWSDGTIGPCAYFTRQFSIWDPAQQRYLTPAGQPKEWILGFAFGFQYPSSLKNELGELMYWTEDFASRDEFIAAIESARAFKCVLSSRPDKSELTIECP